MATTIGLARKGDIVEFRSHRLRVEAEPEIRGNRIRLEGRESRDGCAHVSRWYFCNLPVVSIVRET